MIRVDYILSIKKGLKKRVQTASLNESNLNQSLNEFLYGTDDIH